MIDKPAGLVVHPAPGPRRGHAGQCADRPLRRRASRASAGSGGRASSTGWTRTRPGFSSSPRPTPPIRASPTSSPITAAAARLTREYLALVWGGFDVPAGKVERRDRPRIARHREKMAVASGGARPPRGDPLAGRGGVRTGEPDRLPARDRAHASDPGPHGLDRPSAARRFGLRRGVQDQGRAACPRARERRSRRSAGRRCTRRCWASSIRSPASRCVSRARRPQDLWRLINALARPRVTV